MMKSRTTIKLVFSLMLAIVVCFSCKKDHTTTNNLPGTYSFHINETKKIVEGNDIVSITLEKVHDTRCPTTVQCPTGGFVSTEVRLRYGVVNQIITLCLGNCDAEAKTFMFRGLKYGIALTDLTPHPSPYAYFNAAPPNAKIVISKL